MNFSDYQKRALTTDLSPAGNYKPADSAFMDKVLGLVGETGEVAEKFKKILRDKGGELSEEDRKDIAKELGDVLWYLATVSHYLGVPLEEIASNNLEKLASRKARGVQGGSGDNR